MIHGIAECSVCLFRKAFTLGGNPSCIDTDGKQITGVVQKSSTSEDDEKYGGCWYPAYCLDCDDMTHVNTCKPELRCHSCKSENVENLKKGAALLLTGIFANMFGIAVLRKVPKQWRFEPYGEEDYFRFNFECPKCKACALSFPIEALIHSALTTITCQP